jgi:predicted GNAT family N-acyltransferase
MKLLMDEARHRGLTSAPERAAVGGPLLRELGFRAEGEVFEEAGIPHRNMRMSLG